MAGSGSQTAIAVLVIGGSDSSGGAGVQADLKTLTELGIYAVTAVTSVTSQDSRGVASRFDLPPRIIADQIEAAARVARIEAIKIGMVGTAAAAEVIVSALREAGLSSKVVIDPVLEAEAGGRLADEDARSAMVRELFPIASLVTPNAAEAAVLSGEPISSRDGAHGAARKMIARGARAALITGLDFDGPDIHDYLLEKPDDTGSFLSAPKLEHSAHGTGCTMSSAIAGYLAGGEPLAVAVDKAGTLTRSAMTRAIVLSDGWRISNQRQAAPADRRR